MTRKDAERQEYLEKLRELLNPGDVVYTTVKHVSRSGMSRSIDVQIIRDNEPRWLSFWVAKALGRGFDEKRECVKSSGCGMNMGFELVYALSSALFPDGFICTGDGTRTNSTGEWLIPCCPSNDHVNGDRDYTPHKHNSGGYALRQKWM